jgi:hypothetical protein
MLTVTGRGFDSPRLHFYSFLVRVGLDARRQLGPKLA